jgi:hypothetical protein
MAREQLALAKKQGDLLEEKPDGGVPVPAAASVVLEEKRDGGVPLARPLLQEMDGVAEGDSSVIDPATVRAGYFVVCHSIFEDATGADVPGISVCQILGAGERVEGYLRWPVLSYTPQYIGTSRACVSCRWSKGPAGVEDHVYLYSVLAVVPKLARGWLPMWVRDHLQEQDFFSQMIE